MPRGRRKKSEEEPKLGYTSGFAGEKISINLKHRTYFGLGEEEDMKIWLSPENWSDTVPEGLSKEEVSILEKLISSGDLVLGEKWIPPVDKDKEVLNKYVSLLSDTQHITEDFKSKIRELFRYKQQGHYTALEIFEAMLEDEKKRRRRVAFITYLQEAIDNYIGPVQLVQDYPDDPENYYVTVDQGTKQVTSSSKKELDSSGLEFKGLDDPSIRLDKIEEALG